MNGPTTTDAWPQPAQPWAMTLPSTALGKKAVLCRSTK